MFNKRQLVALLDRRFVRRIVLVPLTLVGACIAVLFSPVIIIAAALTDIITKRTGLPRTRLALLVIGALAVETIGIVAGFVYWIITGFGFAGSDRWRWQLYRNYMGRYTNALLTLITRVLGTTIEWRDTAQLSAGPVVFVARHTSFFDAVIPATVLSRRNDLLAHHVVTHGLRYSPCIDIVGHRFPNRFIKRTPGEGSAELEHIAKIGGYLDTDSAAIIFPEGTFRSPDRFERAVRRLRRRQPELADRAQRLEHVLPPRANGAYALLQGAPTADVVVCANTGFEPFGTIRQIIDRPIADHPIVVETWRIPRSEIPDDADAFAEWLVDQYVAIDTWVTTQWSQRRPA